MGSFICNEINFITWDFSGKVWSVMALVIATARV